MFLRRLFAGLIFLIAGVVFLLCVAGGVGIWLVKEPVTTRATHTFGRIDAGLELAEQSLSQVKASLASASGRLDSAKQEQRALAQDARKGLSLGRMLGRTIQRQVAPEIGNAHEKLHTVAEAAVVVNAVLEDVGNIPFLSVAGFDTSRLTDMNSRLADVAPAAWELSRLLGEPTPESDAADAQLSRIEQTVKTLQGMVADYESQVTQVRQRAGDVKARAMAWVTPAVIFVSVLCAWLALSQLSVMSHARSWW